MPSVRPVLRLLVMLLAAASAGGACARCRCVTPPGGASPSTAVSAPLIASLTVSAAADSVHLVLQVTNAGTAPLRVDFPSGQSYDFSVRAGGRILWTWSADRGFIQMVRAETLAPGETRTYAEAWRPPPGTRGALTAVATLTSSSHPVQRTTTFHLP